MEILELKSSKFKPFGTISVFWDYFLCLQKEFEGGLPPRTAFDPLKVASILPKLAVSEFVDEDTQIVRLVGGGHDGLWPENLAGRNFFDFLEPHMIEGRQKAYKEIINRPCGCLIEDQTLDVEGRSLWSKGLVLPTLNSDGAPTLFIGCYEFEADNLEMQAITEAGISGRKTASLTFLDLFS